MLNNIVDNYSHPDKSLLYVKESFKGPGVKDDLFYDFFENVCACTENRCSEVEGCYCLQTYGRNYEIGVLKHEQLYSQKGVFECSRFCCCGASCSNSVVQAGPNKELHVQNTIDKGYGVFAGVHFPKGAFICEYAGEVIGPEEARKRLRDPDCTRYLMLVREHWETTIIETYVDASKAGNIGRYLNHSCDPNCVVIPVRIGRLVPRLCFFTSKPVAVGEELSYFYCPDSKVLSKMPCCCGSQKCLGFIPSA